MNVRLGVARATYNSITIQKQQQGHKTKNFVGEGKQ